MFISPSASESSEGSSEGTLWAVGCSQLAPSSEDGNGEPGKTELDRLKHKKLHVNMRKNCFTLRVAEH